MTDILIGTISSPNPSEQSAAKSLQLIYTIILSLAIGEAIRQLVDDSPKQADGGPKQEVRWNRLVALGSFLLLAVPFIHGMNRYFFEVYIRGNGRPDAYSGYLFLDTIALTIEAILFFMLSRSLGPEQSRRFLLTICALLGLDVAWGAFVAWQHTPAIIGWVVVNAATLPFLILLLLLWRKSDKSENQFLFSCIGLLIIAIRTALDYVCTWSFYFPS